MTQKSRRIIVEALKRNGVDIQVYFNGVINGPHCVKFVNNGIKIIDHIKSKMMKEVSDDEMKLAMSTFVDKFKVILTHTQSIQKILMSTKAQDVKEFRDHRDVLRRAIVDLVEFSEGTFGKEKNKLSLPLTLKRFSLFGDDMIDSQFVNWNNTGAVDEENNESAHADMNNVQSLFGASRGDNQKKMMMDRLLLRCNTELSKGVADLLSATGQRKETEEKRKVKAMERRNAREAAESNDVASRDGHEDEEEEEVDDEEEYNNTALREKEKAMNLNDRLRVPAEFEHENAAIAEGLRSMDTTLHVCPKCTSGRKVWVGEESLRIHIQECHSVNLQEEHDAIDGRIT